MIFARIAPCAYSYQDTFVLALSNYYVFVLHNPQHRGLQNIILHGQTRAFRLFLTINQPLRPFPGTLVAFKLACRRQLAAGHGAGRFQQLL